VLALLLQQIPPKPACFRAKRNRAAPPGFFVPRPWPECRRTRLKKPFDSFRVSRSGLLKQLAALLKQAFVFRRVKH
jgi:hypothetical protein